MEFFIYAINSIYGMNNFYGADKLSVEEVGPRRWIVSVLVGEGELAITKKVVVLAAKSGKVRCYAY
jgi:hypothetical protein